MEPRRQARGHLDLHPIRQDNRDVCGQEGIYCAVQRSVISRAPRSAKEKEMTIVLDGSGLTVDKLVRIARDGEAVEIPAGALDRIRACRQMIEAKIQAREILDGVNTGIGEFSEVVL